MITVPSPNDREMLSQKAAKMTQLTTLIREYPAEAQLIMAAVEDGLTLGPAQILAGDLPDHESVEPTVRAAVATVASD